MLIFGENADFSEFEEAPARSSAFSACEFSAIFLDKENTVAVLPQTAPVDAIMFGWSCCFDLNLKDLSRGRLTGTVPVAPATGSELSCSRPFFGRFYKAENFHLR